MKVTKVKVGVTSLAIAAVAAMVGSISGTVAWFQYSTRASAAYTAATAHCTESIQIRAGEGDWKTALEVTDIADYIKAARESEDTSLRPVTTGEQKKDGHLNKLFKSPIYQYANMETWQEADKMDYVQIPLEFRALDVDGEGDNLLSKKVWLTKTLISQTNGDVKKDISDAIRVHFDSDQNNNDFLISKQGNDVTTIGELDLNGDGASDKAADWNFPGDPESDLVLYGIDPALIRGQFANDDDAIATLAQVPEDSIYLNSADTKDYILREGNWEEVNTGNAAAKYAGAFADDDAAFAGICLPNGKIYKNTSDSKYYLFNAGAWGEIAAVDKGTYADDEAAQVAIASPLMVDGKFYKNSTDGKVYVWQGAPAGSWAALDDAAAFKGEFADEDEAALEIAKAGIAAGFIYQKTDSSFYVWEDGDWKGIEASAGYIGAFADDWHAEDSLGAGELAAGKIYKVGAGSYKKYNGSAWVAIPANGDGAAQYADGDDAILAEGTALADGDMFKDTTADKYKVYDSGAWGDITPDTTAEDGNAAIIALKGSDALASYVAGWYYTITGGTEIRMWNGSAWIAVPEYVDGLTAQKDLDPVEEGTLYKAPTKYRIFKSGAWEDAYYNDEDADGDSVKGYADEHIAELAINHDIYTDGVDDEYLKAGDFYYNTADKAFKELKWNAHDRYVGWEEKSFLAESYIFNSNEVIADDSNPRNIVDGKELGKTVISVDDAAALAALTGMNEGDLAYNQDDKLQYVYNGTAWVVNADETVSVLPSIAGLDEAALAKSYYLDTVDGDYGIGIYEVINGQWYKRDGQNLRVYLTIYLEGWQELEGSAIWNAEDYVGAQFNVGLRFSGEAHTNH